MATTVENGTTEVEKIEDVEDGCVLIAGAGPVGLLLAVVLSSYGVKSILLERNQTTTKWPKMDLTNARSMEIFRRLGLADGLRAKGVPSHIPSTVLISSGLNQKEAITKWAHPSVDQYRERIRENNDGSQPLEPYQRISQAVFEAWLKTICDKDPLIDARFGWKVVSVEENDSGTVSVASDVVSGAKTTFKSKFIIGCDGASSTVRRSLGIPLDGGPVPGYVILVHFKSKDLTRLQSQGQFWHIFFLGKEGLGGAIIAQDEVDTWTVHYQMPLDADHTQFESEDVISLVLGGLGEKYNIKVDEILVRSTYRPSIAIARQYASAGGHVYLAGDAAHQNIPTGGYGMNLGLGDAFDLGWKLAAVVNGGGGSKLLASYEADRRPVAMKCIERSGVHMATHFNVKEILQPDPFVVDANTEEGAKARKTLHDHYQANDGENTDLGIEMGLRYKSDICIPDNDESVEPEWVPSKYTPTTWPGSRAPHVFLKDGSPIYDHLGKDYTLVEFARSGEAEDESASHLLSAAKADGVRLTYVKLVDEDNARQLWEKRLVIVRPDAHVSWRSNNEIGSKRASEIVQVIAGIAAAGEQAEGIPAEANGKTAATFTMVQNEVQDKEYTLSKMGAFQQ